MKEMSTERIPLAERMRPQSLDDVIGQHQILDDGEILRRIVANKEPVSLILWGPPGSGKTTLARIVAREVRAEFVELSAVTSGKKDVERVVEHARQNWNLKLRTILFVDEIHRFNKAQQDAFLPHVESGLITLIGATTENPSFEIITPLLSRTRVLVLDPIAKSDMIALLNRCLKEIGATKKVLPTAIDYIAEASGGDARVALGTLELSLTIANKVTRDVAQTAAGKSIPGYDKKGEMHYSIVSAFIKSMRGGDDTAALYYLARMLQAGEDPKFIARRMIIFASEDIGLAGNGALGLSLQAFQAVERVGLPECNYILFHVATALARSAKSRETSSAMYAAMELAKNSPNLPVPLHLRNATTKLMQDLGYGKDYEWSAGFEHKKGYMPDKLGGAKLFNPKPGK